MPDCDVKTIWAHELAGFAQSKEQLECIAWALENLPETPPNVIKFRNLCRQAPAAPVPRLEAPKADPARVAAELAKLGTLRAGPAPAVTNLSWAHGLKAREEAGERLNPTTRTMYRQALGMPIGRGA